MRFGLLNKHLCNANLYLFLILCSILVSCNEEPQFGISFLEPNQGQNFESGKLIKIKLDTEGRSKIDTVLYLVDNNVVAEKKNADSIWITTGNLPLGYRMISAIVIQGDKRDTISTNIVLKANQPPIKLNYTIVNTYRHNTSSYTEGLSYIDDSGAQGKLLESTGENGASALKYVDLKTGKDLQQVKLGPQYFGEGCVKIDNKIIMLTWHENIGFIFDAKTFDQLGTFLYQISREGWGLTFDGKNILRSDGTNRIWRMNALTYKEESYLEVYDNNGPIDSLNELEYIDGKIYANVYPTNKIIRINPISGAVEAEIDLSALVPKNYFKTAEEAQNNVLNGIAWDSKRKRLFVVGKKWPQLFEIKLSNNQ
jgi:glutamine cyclotransferase